MLRIIPIGGVFLAVLIVLLAISPPRESQRDVSPEMVLARGALIDRREHPEWSQFLIRTAFHRAGEILKLRDLPDTPTVTTPVPLPPHPPAAADAPAPVAKQADDDAARDDAAPTAAAAKTKDVVATLANDVDHVKQDAAPAPSAMSVQADRAAPEPATTAPAVAPAPAPQPVRTAAAPAEIAASVPLPPPAPTIKVATLPVERPATDPDPDQATDTADSSENATIPVDIGETSSTELPIALPPERPPVLRMIERQRSSRKKRSPHRHRAAAKPAPPPSNEQPASQTNLFELLFKGAAGAHAEELPPRGKNDKNAKTASAAYPYPPIVVYPITSP